MFRYLPEQGSTFAAEVDRVHNLMTDLSVFFTVAIVGTMLYFAIKYRKRNGVDHDTPPLEGNNLLEIIWTVLPAIICVVVAADGWIAFKKIREVPDNALEINVTGEKWFWSFQYANGKQTANEFVVPVNQPVKLILTSKDVLHSFFVPGMRTKMDAVPGRYTYQWFEPIKTGDYQVFCTEYCGTNHSGMLAKLKVVSQGEYDRWINEKPKTGTPADAGRALYQMKGCNSCHSLDGTKGVGPSFLNLYNRAGTFQDGKEYVADDQYLNVAILRSQENIVSGFLAGAMPVFEGQLTQEEVGNLIAFIKTVKGVEKKVVAPVVDKATLSPAERGKLIYQEKTCIGCHSLDGSKVVGPSFKGLYGSIRELDDGSSVTADDGYIQESIYEPQSKIVKGFQRPSPMPAFKGILTDEDVSDVIEYLKSLK
jgi:cytochrome c oxidase subunit II